MAESFKLLIGYAIFAVAAISFLSFVNAEEVDFTQITPECKGPFSVIEETILGNKTTTVWNCLWVDVQLEPRPITVIQNTTDKEKKIIKDAKECRESNYTLPGCFGSGAVVPFTPRPGLTPEQNKLLDEADEIYNARCGKGTDNLDKDDTELCNLYAERSLCERGYEESEPIQSHDWFVTSLWKTNIWLMFDLDTEAALKKMMSAVEGCTAQDTLHDELGRWYLNRQKANIIDAVPNHRDLAANIYQPIHPMELTPAVHATTIKVAVDTRCELRQFMSTWIDYKCPKVEKHCEMPTDEFIAAAELALVPAKEWYISQALLNQFYEGKEVRKFYQERYVECIEPDKGNPNPDFDIIKETQPYKNREVYRTDPKASTPYWVPDQSVTIKTCGNSYTGECGLTIRMD